MDAQLRGFPDMAAARAAAYRVVANASVAVLPLVGIISTDGTVSCFVEVPFNLAEADPRFVSRTVLRVGAHPQVVLSLPDLVQGRDRIGFLLTSRPIWLAGEQYQPEDADLVIALVEGVTQSVGVQLIGPIRCRRCNHPVPAERARALRSTNCLCIRCKLAEEAQ